MQIAVINASRRLKNVEVAFMVQACAEQALQCADAWGVAPIAVAFYSSTVGLPAADCMICEIVDDLDQPGALGYHTDAAGVIYLRVLAQGFDTSVTLSHEVLETLIDPTCAGWRARGDGSQVALEGCDPVEGDVYGAPAEVLGETRTVQLSNYVLPAWFDRTLPTGSVVDAMHTASGPFAMTAGGYMIVTDAAGNETEVFARIRSAGLAGLATAGKRLAVGNSRLLRRLRGRHRGSK